MVQNNWPVEPPKSIRDFHEKYGSGWYEWNYTLGLGNIAYINSSLNVYVYDNYGTEDNQARHYVDKYDFLRALEEGVVRKLTSGEILSLPYRAALEEKAVKHETEALRFGVDLGSVPLIAEVFPDARATTGASLLETGLKSATDEKFVHPEYPTVIRWPKRVIAQSPLRFEADVKRATDELLAAYPTLKSVEGPYGEKNDEYRVEIAVEGRPSLYFTVVEDEFIEIDQNEAVVRVRANPAGSRLTKVSLI